MGSDIDAVAEAIATGLKRTSDFVLLTMRTGGEAARLTLRDNNGGHFVVTVEGGGYE